MIGINLKNNIKNDPSLEIENPELRNNRFIRQVNWLVFLLFSLLTLLCLTLAILASWKAWTFSTLLVGIVTAVTGYNWWLAAYKNKTHLSARLNVIILSLIFDYSYWQAPYYAFYLSIVLILTVSCITLGLKETMLVFGFHFLNTVVYAIVNNNKFYSSDFELIKLNYQNLIIWWLIIGAIIWMFSFLFNTTQQDNTLLQAQAEELKNTLAELKQKQAEQLKAEEALRYTQAQLLQAQKMESIGRLAGGVAHDFNNLLTAITGYSELVLQTLPENDPLQSDLNEILSTTDKATSLTRQLLAFSRRQVLQPQLVDVNEIIREINKLLKRLIGEDIELNFLPGSGSHYIMADRGQIEQVVMNLVVNARDAMPGGGQLTIETTSLYLDEEYFTPNSGLSSIPKSGQYVMLAISDTGIGMDAETQSHIFEPFFTTKGLGQGTGLGLATSYGIVEQSGGYIFVYSVPGVGTTFKIFLPQANSSSEEGIAVETKPRPEALYGSETILVVEDDKVLQQLIQRILTKYGYRTLIASQGKEALAILEENFYSVDLVLTDLIMPQMSGKELAEHISRCCPGLRIVGMSGYTNHIATQQDLINLIDGYIQKPFTTTSLVGKLREILDMKLVIRQSEAFLLTN